MKKGDIVYWNDPEGLTSDFYKIENIEPDNDIVFIVNKHSEAEVFRYEIKPVNIKIHQGFWTRDQVARDVDSVYVFGDNAEDAYTNFYPSRTQAVIRGLVEKIDDIVLRYINEGRIQIVEDGTELLQEDNN